MLLILRVKGFVTTLVDEHELEESVDSEAPTIVRCVLANSGRVCTIACRVQRENFLVLEDAVDVFEKIDGRR